MTRNVDTQALAPGGGGVRPRVVDSDVAVESLRRSGLAKRSLLDNPLSDTWRPCAPEHMFTMETEVSAVAIVETAYPQGDLEAKHPTAIGCQLIRHQHVTALRHSDEPAIK